MDFCKSTFLFSQRIYLEELRRFNPSSQELDKKLDVLERLQKRTNQGQLIILNESKIEQSFNERLFCDLFDYKSVLRNSTGRYDLEPKKYTGNAYNDFSLGEFGIERPRYEVSAELKGPEIDLFEPQVGANYGGKSPVEQAIAAATKDVAFSWIIASNFSLILLFCLKSKDSSYIEFDLRCIGKRSQMRELLFVFQKGGLYKFKGVPGRLEVVKRRSMK